MMKFYIDFRIFKTKINVILSFAVVPPQIITSEKRRFFRDFLPLRLAIYQADKFTTTLRVVSDFNRENLLSYPQHVFDAAHSKNL